MARLTPTHPVPRLPPIPGRVRHRRLPIADLLLIIKINRAAILRLHKDLVAKHPEPAPGPLMQIRSFLSDNKRKLHKVLTGRPIPGLCHRWQ